MHTTTPAIPTPPDAPQPAPPTPIRIVPRESLQQNREGITAGSAHVGFDGHPADAPGHLDFEPLLLCAIGEVAPGTHAPLHDHAGVEILDVVQRGRFAYVDSLGNDLDLGPGTVSATSTGRGMRHGVTVGADPCRLLVVFLRSSEPDAEPSVSLRPDGALPEDALGVLASGRADAPPDALPIRCDAALLGARLRPGAAAHHVVEPGRRAYLLSMEGSYEIDGQVARDGDRVLVEGPAAVKMTAREATELLVIDLPRPAAGATTAPPVV